VEVQLAGGSGYGDPADRARAALEDDVADGYVSRDAAQTAYRGGKLAAE
jgi:N-methylhydantoinase B/oxoprolinase/acetone carboxylase alpha subunit